MIQCVECNMAFPSPEALEQHLLSNHATPGKKLSPATPAPPINSQFEEVMRQITEEKKNQPVQVISSPEPTKLESLQLTYKYTGTDLLGHPVETLEMEVDHKWFVSAFCLVEKKQIEVQEVVHLTNEESNTIVKGISKDKK